MKLKKILLLSSLILIVIVTIIYFLLNYGFNKPCDTPERPQGLTNKAIWKGDCDGGNWIELVSIKKDTLRFKVFRDWDGELILDDYFIPKDCNGFQFTLSNWNKHIAYFGNYMVLYEDSNLGNCRLVPISSYSAFKKKDDSKEINIL